MEERMPRVSEISAALKFKRAICRHIPDHKQQRPVGFYPVRYVERDGEAAFTPVPGVGYESYFHPGTGEPLFRPVTVYV